MAKKTIRRCIHCGVKATEEEYQSDSCKHCGKKFSISPSTDNEYSSEDDISESKAAQELGGAGIAEFFIVIGWVTVIVGGLLLVFFVVGSAKGWLFPAVAVINGGLITVILGVVARAVVVNANINLKILEHFENQRDLS